MCTEVDAPQIYTFCSVLQQTSSACSIEKSFIYVMLCVRYSDPLLNVVNGVGLLICVADDELLKMSQS